MQNKLLKGIYEIWKSILRLVFFLWHKCICIRVYLFHTTGVQADVEQRFVAELRWVVAEHHIWASNSHPFVLQPAKQPGQLTVTVKGVTAQVTGREEERAEENVKYGNTYRKQSLFSTKQIIY